MPLDFNRLKPQVLEPKPIPVEPEAFIGIPVEFRENEDDTTVESLEALQGEVSGRSASGVPTRTESQDRAYRLNAQYLTPHSTTSAWQLIEKGRFSRDFQTRFGYAYPGSQEQLWTLINQAAEIESNNSRLFDRKQALDLYEDQLKSFKLAYTNPDEPELTDEEIANELIAQEDELSIPTDESDLVITGMGDIIDPASLANSNLFDSVEFSLDPSQKNAVEGLVKAGHGCLIGAAGTGKTTSTKALVRTLVLGDAAAGIEPLRLQRVDIRKYHEKAKEANAKRGRKAEEDDPSKNVVVPSIALVAFTGQATQVLKKNMPRGWAKNIMTIHSLLGFAPINYTDSEGNDKLRFEPTYNKYNKMPWDRIFIDEASMVPLDLWHQMLDAMKPGSKVYMIGDLNQLPPPIGVGIFGFALSKWPVFELTTVHRQSEPAANRIVETAHDILNGRPITYDDPKVNKDWRVIGFELSGNAEKAQEQIVSLAIQLSKTPVHVSVNPEQPMVYQPMRDRIMVPMNGFNPNQASSFIGQAPLNEILAEVFVDKTVPRMIIDFKKGRKRWSVGNRVMATRNEGPGTEDRVTNGLTGEITSIVENPKWPGDRRLVGDEKRVKENRRHMAQAINDQEHVDELAESFTLEAIMDAASDVKGRTEEEERQGGPASHIVTVKFVNGATREYKLNAQIEQLQLAYASTVHKTQGAEMPFAIVVVHNMQRQMLSRELLYTAVTRASQRLLILYTDMGWRIAMATQKISGRTLKEKIAQYMDLMGESESNRPFQRIMNVRLTPEEEDSESYNYDEDRQDNDADNLAAEL